MTAVRFDRVEKSFRAFASPLGRLAEVFVPFARARHTVLPILRNLTFEVDRGESVAIIGANGVGKSTILHLVAGLIEPTSGRITVDGRVTSLLDLGGSFRPDLTGRENARFFHQVVARSPSDLESAERRVAEFADLGEFFDRPVRTYSSGMFLRLAFACAAAEDPDILLIDEVLAVGDARFQQKCYHRLRELRERGTTILLVTHVVQALPGVCDRAIVLEQGRIVFDGDPGRAIERYYQLFFAAPERQTETVTGRELRYGMGGASITNISVRGTRRPESTTFEAGERVQIELHVEFTQPVAAPQFGIACATKEGLRIYATTTTMLGDEPAPARAGERRSVEIQLTLAVAVADLFVDLSVFEVVDGAVIVLDTRIAALHLVVAPLRHCIGTTDLSASMRVVSDNHAPAHS